MPCLLAFCSIPKLDVHDPVALVSPTTTLRKLLTNQLVDYSRRALSENFTLWFEESEVGRHALEDCQ